MTETIKTAFTGLKSQAAIRYSYLVIFLGTLCRAYGLFDHWKTHDHYNYGGVMIQVWVRCLKEVPFDISWGRLIYACDPGKLDIYKNHAPFFMWPLWGISYFLGEGEWVMRSYYLFFSAMNIWLTFTLARRGWPQKPYLWVLSSFFQSFFLSGLYLGTHPENISEITLTFMLISAHLALSKRIVSSALMAIFSGLTSWVGYFQFAPLLLYSWVKKRDFSKLLWCTVLGVIVCYFQMVYLRGTFAIWDFVGYKLANPEYVRPQGATDILLLPFRFLKSFLTSQGRMLNPLFAAWAFYEISVGTGRDFWKYKREKLAELSDSQWAIILSGFGGLAYLIPGFRYAMVHFFNYVFLMPMYAMLCALFVNRLLTAPSLDQAVTHKKLLAFLILIFTIVYPYGIYKSNPIHDAINSVVLICLALWFLYAIFRNELRFTWIMAFLAVGALANFSQVINYRNEPDTEFTFCEKARAEYEQTNLLVQTTEKKTMAKELLYCRGIPIEYLTNPETPQ
jgi:hypothetical protein